VKKGLTNRAAPIIGPAPQGAAVFHGATAAGNLLKKLLPEALEERFAAS
jgi:hypothetical protein